MKVDKKTTLKENYKERPDIFPNKWRCNTLNSADVYWLSGNINRSSSLITKSRLNSCYWRMAKLTKLVNETDADWGFDDEMILCVWDVQQLEKEPPLGFVSFNLAWNETRYKKISEFFLTVHLIWVRPDKRGLGGVVARHVTAHLLMYLRECKLIPPHVTREGVTVFYCADLYSLGGEKVSFIIADYFHFMKAAKLWKINSVVFEAGF